MKMQKNRNLHVISTINAEKNEFQIVNSTRYEFIC